MSENVLNKNDKFWDKKQVNNHPRVGLRKVGRKN